MDHHTTKDHTDATIISATEHPSTDRDSSTLDKSKPHAHGVRERLPNRRPCETISFRCNGLDYVASIGRFADGRLAEIFISSGKAESHADVAARDSSITFSIACQYGTDPPRPLPR
jgi:hypothetical protein